MQHSVRQSWQLWAGVLSDDQCNRIVDICEKSPVEKATTFSGDGDLRRSKVRWTEDQDVGAILWDYTQKANEVLGVDIEPYTSIQYTEYHGSEGGHYDNHHDIDWRKADGRDRKLSITIQLSCPTEYMGGEFRFTEVENPPMDALKKRGSILVFPSYLVHAVTPVTSGLRKSVVAWFEGPTWK